MFKVMVLQLLAGTFGCLSLKLSLTPPVTFALLCAMSLLHALPCLSVTVLPHPAMHFPAMACGGALSGGSSFSQNTTTSYSLTSHLHNRSDDINEALQNLDRVLQGEWIWNQPNPNCGAETPLWNG